MRAIYIFGLSIKTGCYYHNYSCTLSCEQRKLYFYFFIWENWGLRSSQCGNCSRCLCAAHAHAARGPVSKIQVRGQLRPMGSFLPPLVLIRCPVYYYTPSRPRRPIAPSLLRRISTVPNTSRTCRKNRDSTMSFLLGFISLSVSLYKLNRRKPPWF